MRRVTLVCGPPCAGKSSYVDARDRGALVVDYDRIAAELGSSGHEHSEHTRSRVRARRAELERQVAAMRDGTAYVVRSLADGAERADVARRIGATDVVVLAPDRDVLEQRAEQRPNWTRDVIRRWFVEWSSLPATGTYLPQREVIMTDDNTAQTDEQTDPNAATAEGQEDSQAQPETGSDGGESDIDYWKRRARENEQRAKDNHKELEKLRHESMSEQERAIAEARDAGRSEALREASSRLVEAEVRSAAAGRPINVDTLLSGLDRAQFVTDDGEVDRDAVTGWLDQLAPVQQQPQNTGDLAQGARGVNRSSPDEVFGELIASSLK